MKRKFLTALCIGTVILACNKNKSTVATPPTQNNYTHGHLAARFMGDSTDTFGSSQFIPMGVANVMITSYLASINSADNDSDVHSFSVNADSLRALLSDNSIKNVKLIFAHTMAYINAGNYGVNAGYQSGAMTIIMAGYTASGNYVYYNTNMVLDHVIPCPYSCPAGTAGGDQLQ